MAYACEGGAPAPRGGCWTAMARDFGAGQGSGEDWKVMEAGSKAELAWLVWDRFRRAGDAWEPSPCSRGWIVELPPRSRWARDGGRQEAVAFEPSGAWADPFGLAAYGRQLEESGRAEEMGWGGRWTWRRARPFECWGPGAPVPGTGKRSPWRRSFRGPSLGFGAKAGDAFACRSAAMDLDEMEWGGACAAAAKLASRAQAYTDQIHAWWDDWGIRSRRGNGWKSQGRDRQWRR